MEGLKLSATSDAIIDTDLAKRHQENLTHSLQLFQVVRSDGEVTKHLLRSSQSLEGRSLQRNTRKLS